MGSYLPSLSKTRCPKTQALHQLGVDHATDRRLPSVGTALGSFGHQHGSFLKDPWMVLGDIFLEVSNPNMFLYEFKTSHINFIQNEQIILEETCYDIRGISRKIFRTSLMLLDV